jgi:hypothetical protein
MTQARMRDSSSSRRLFSKAWARNRDRSRAGTRLTNLVANSSGRENVIFLAAIMPYYDNHFEIPLLGNPRVFMDPPLVFVLLC